MKKKYLLILLIAILVLPIWGKKSKVEFFSPKSLYFYTMGTSIYINPYPEEGFYSKENELSLIYGIGYTIVNLYNKSHINFEFDFSRTHFDLFRNDRKIDFYNFKLTYEYLGFMKLPIIVYGGLGVTNIAYSSYDIWRKYDDTTMVIDLGLKISLNKNFRLRTEFRFFTNPGNSDYYYIDDEIYWWGDEEGELIGTAVSLGLEFHF